MLYWGLAASAGVLSIIALIYDLEQMYFIAVTVLGLPWLSRILSANVRHTLRAAVQTSGEIKLHAGDMASVRVAIYNSGRMPRSLCRASLDLPEGLELVRERTDQVDTLAPDSATHLDVRFRPTKRGVYQVDRARVLTTDFMGIFEFAVDLDDIDILVTAWPRLHGARRMPWLENQASDMDSYDLHALEDGSSHGEVATDFFGVREYVPGDEIRRIHWPSTARHQAFTVIEYVSQQRGSLTLFLDLDRSSYDQPGGDEALEEVISLSATICKVAISQAIPVRIIAQGAEDYSLARQEGLSDMEIILDRLARVAADGDQPLDLIVRRRARIAQEGGIVLVTARHDGVLERAQAAASAASRTSRALVVDAESFAGAGERTAPRAIGRNGALALAKGDDPVAFLERAR
jgi:uncharacterized protein (DUF58 family)